MSTVENSTEKPGSEVKKESESESQAKATPQKEEADKGKKTAPSPAPTPTPPSSETSGSAQKQPTFQEQFRSFSKFGASTSDGKHITLSQSDKWMKQALVIDGKKITTTDTGIYFKKFKQMKIGISDYVKFLEELAKVKKIEVTELKSKMRSCGAPGTTGTTAVVKSSAVERLSSDNPKKSVDSPRGRTSHKSAP